MTVTVKVKANARISKDGILGQHIVTARFKVKGRQATISTDRIIGQGVVITASTELKARSTITGSEIISQRIIATVTMEIKGTIAITEGKIIGQLIVTTIVKEIAIKWITSGVIIAQGIIIATWKSKATIAICGSNICEISIADIVQMYGSAKNIRWAVEFDIMDNKIGIRIGNSYTRNTGWINWIVTKDIGIIYSTIAPGTGPFAISRKISITIYADVGMGRISLYTRWFLARIYDSRSQSTFTSPIITIGNANPKQGKHSK